MVSMWIKLVSLALLCAVTVSVVQADPPRIPGAESTVRWDTSDAPFHVATALKLPVEERNAAALYLDALFEFSGEVVTCFDDSQGSRQAKAQKLNKRYIDLSNAWEKDRKSVDVKDIDALVAEYTVGFQKIRKAQERPECAFEAGLTFTGVLPHVQAARHVARMIDMKSRRDIANGNNSAVLDDVEMVLRLAGDLRNRGYLINHLVTIAIESVTLQGPVERVLQSKNCTVRDCDRLLEILRAYRPNQSEEFLVSVQIEYVSNRSFLHDLQNRVGDFDLKGRADKDNEPLKLLDVFEQFIGGQDSDSVRDSKKRVATMNADDYRHEVNWLDLTYFRVKQARQLPYAERRQRLKNITDEAVKNTILLRHTLAAYVQAMDAFVRSDTRLAGTECLIALKRWQLSHPKLKRAPLKTILEESGASQIPADPFATRRPMQINWNAKEPVIYSIGSDGRNQNGVADWKYGTQPGDFLFRIN
jgi:hypothetical protein